MEREKINNLYDLLCEFYDTYNLKENVYDSIDIVLNEISSKLSVSDLWKLKVNMNADYEI